MKQKTKNRIKLQNILVYGLVFMILLLMFLAAILVTGLMIIGIQYIWEVIFNG